MQVNEELLRTIQKAGAGIVVSGLFGWYMWLNHLEKISAMEDKNGVYVDLLERQTEYLGDIARIYKGD